jgi:hypothetical protein
MLRFSLVGWTRAAYRNLVLDSSVTNRKPAELSQRLVRIFRHGIQDRGMLVQERYEPGSHLPEPCSVVLGIGFRA